VGTEGEEEEEEEEKSRKNEIAFHFPKYPPNKRWKKI
jgi:hypothetical protein